MAESINLVLHMMTGLGFIGLIYWVVRLQKRIKLQTSVIRSIRNPQVNLRISGSFRVLLSQLCETLGVSFVCEEQIRDACVLSLGDWVREMINNDFHSCELTKKQEELVLLFKGQKKLSLEKLQNTVKFLNRTQIKIQFIEENKK